MGRCFQGTGPVAMSQVSVLNSPVAWLRRDDELIHSVSGGDENKPDKRGLWRGKAGLLYGAAGKAS